MERKMFNMKKIKNLDFRLGFIKVLIALLKHSKETKKLVAMSWDNSKI